ncbi:hypothetical protein PR202_ga08027 [Eleusine coracana subsp. coracana]|uniref:Reverse transcriptase zinc-binding domain-containing protein n=1 Tax=Eleusine coracana subsp. coracana TaxID=191504 RepID=A0AAV5C068_ELECO|nr:hypothetical protein PR202_ga08027 [Eleusine coracana subsp. coracana]
MWKSCCKSRIKFFFWLLLRDRINTRNLLRRKTRTLDFYNCELCAQDVEETLLHLFFECSFSQNCWHYLGIHRNLNLQPDAMLLQARENFQSRIFREILMVACWTLWCYRNRVIFDEAPTSFGAWKHLFLEEIMLVRPRAKPSVQSRLDLFFNSLL